MELLAKSINFNGTELSKDYAIVSYGAMATQRDNVINQSTLRGNITPYRDVSHFYGLNHTEPLQFDLSLMRRDEKPLTNTERDTLIHWLCGPHDFCKLTVTDWSFSDYHKDIEYFVVCTGYSEFSHNTKIWGYTFHFEANAPYGFTPEYTYELSGGKVEIENLSIDDTPYYPTIELDCTKEETVKIENTAVPGTILTLHVYKGQHLTIDCDMGDITDNIEMFDYGEDSNLTWIYLVPGTNTINVTGSVTGTITCQYPRKVGI